MVSIAKTALFGLCGLFIVGGAPASAVTLPQQGSLTLPQVSPDPVQWREERIIRRGPYGRVVCRIRYQRVVTRSGRIVVRPVEVCRRRGF
jgi:hypothetical protein